MGRIEVMQMKITKRRAFGIITIVVMSLIMLHISSDSASAVQTVKGVCSYGGECLV